jgi:hypothetical protein
MTIYVAAIGTAPDVVAGEHCDLTVAEQYVFGYRIDDDGQERPITGMGDELVLEPVELPVRVDDDDKGQKAIAYAETELAEWGFTRVGPWVVADNAMYADVEREDEPADREPRSVADTAVERTGVYLGDRRDV